MAEKRMLIVDADVVRKIEENRGDMSRSDFLNFLLESQLKEGAAEQKFVDREEFEQFAQGIRDLMRNFLEFFLSYGLELGKQPQDKSFEELTQKLQALASSTKKADKA